MIQSSTPNRFLHCNLQQKCHQMIIFIMKLLGEPINNKINKEQLSHSCKYSTFKPLKGLKLEKSELAIKFGSDYISLISN